MKSLCIWTLALLFGQTIYGQKAENIKAMKEKAAAAYRDHNYEEAVALYEKILTHEPRNIDILFNAGYSYGKLGLDKKKLAKYKLCALYGSKEPVLYQNLGSVYNDLGELEKSYQNYKKSFELEPNGNVLMGACDNMIADDKPKMAIEYMQKNESYAKVDKHYIYGSAYFILKEWKQSIDHFNTFFDEYDATSNTCTYNNVKAFDAANIPRARTYHATAMIYQMKQDKSADPDPKMWRWLDKQSKHMIEREIPNLEDLKIYPSNFAYKNQMHAMLEKQDDSESKNLLYKAYLYFLANDWKRAKLYNEKMIEIASTDKDSREYFMFLKYLSTMWMSLDHMPNDVSERMAIWKEIGQFYNQVYSQKIDPDIRMREFEENPTSHWNNEYSASNIFQYYLNKLIDRYPKEKNLYPIEAKSIIESISYTPVKNKYIEIYDRIVKERLHKN